jgi:hypothetical protein
LSDKYGSIFLERTDTMAVDIPQETLDRVREVLKAAGYSDKKIAAAEEGIKKLAEEYPQAADNFAYWLSGKGGTKYLRPEWLRSWMKVKDAEEVNRGRFVEGTFPKRVAQFENQKALIPGAILETADYWDRPIRAENPRQAGLYYASGISTLTSHGELRLKVEEAKDGGRALQVTGRVDHGWWDIYHWTGGKTFFLPGIGRVSDEQMEKLKDAGAKDYRMESWWSQSVEATLYLDVKGNIINSRSRVEWGAVLYSEDGRRLK